MRNQTFRLLGGAILPLLLLASCRASADQKVKASLERVAKDWSQTIRASQVLPVYPLTEDLQPGDVFAVQVPLGEQQRIYRERGFLPLDQHVVRLPIPAKSSGVAEPSDPKAAASAEQDDSAPFKAELSYERFYTNAYLEGTFLGSPHPRPGWPPSSGTLNGTESDPSGEASRNGDAGDGGFVPMPAAAFPTYNFEVNRSQGLRLALPISGVPFGLGLMGASRARGSVTLRDAYTYGMDIAPLYGRLKQWWMDKEVREAFEQVGRQFSGEVYLRVVNRVYLVRGVSVALQNTSTEGLGADAGVAPELRLLNLATEDPEQWKESSQAFAQTMRALSAGLNPAQTGGSVRLVQASQRSVALEEQFPRPLVIGYLGFDVPVHGDELGVPVPSFSRLEDLATSGEDGWEIETEGTDQYLPELLELFLALGADWVSSDPGKNGLVTVKGWFGDSSRATLAQSVLDDLMADKGNDWYRGEDLLERARDLRTLWE